MNPYIEQDSGKFTFYRVPKALIEGAQYRTVSAEAKLLFGLLLDRLSLSLRSGWQDESGRVYLYYTVSAVQDSLHCCKETACKLLRELEQAGLIERHSQGQGKPDRIYLKRFAVSNTGSGWSEKQTADEGKWSEKQTAPVEKRSEKPTTRAHDRPEIPAA